MSRRGSPRRALAGLLAILLAAEILGLGGRAAQAQTEAAAVLLDEYSFSPVSPVVPSGGVRLLLVNQGLRRHNLTLMVDGQPQESPYLRPGETVLWEPNVVARGVHQFCCNEYRHLEKGMSGELTVK